MKNRITESERRKVYAAAQVPEGQRPRVKLVDGEAMVCIPGRFGGGLLFLPGLHTHIQVGSGWLRRSAQTAEGA